MALERSQSGHDSPDQLTHSPGLARFGLYFNSSRSISLTAGVRCYCGADDLSDPTTSSKQAYNWSMETVVVPWLPQVNSAGSVSSS